LIFNELNDDENEKEKIKKIQNNEYEKIGKSIILLNNLKNQNKIIKEIKILIKNEDFINLGIEHINSFFSKQQEKSIKINETKEEYFDVFKIKLSINYENKNKNEFNLFFSKFNDDSKIDLILYFFNNCPYDDLVIFILY
jgi:hypothetical protein